MSSQKTNVISEVKQDMQNIRTAALSEQQTIVTDVPRVITNTEQTIAQEVPIVTERIVTKEYVPVTYEKVIQKIPVVIGQRVETGAPISQEKYVQALNVEYVENAQQTKVELQPTMISATQGDARLVSQTINMQPQKISSTNLTGVQQTGFAQQTGLGQEVITTTTTEQTNLLQPGLLQTGIGQQGLSQPGLLQPGLGQQGLGQQGQGVGQSIRNKAHQDEASIKQKATNLERDVTGKNLKR